MDQSDQSIEHAGITYEVNRGADEAVAEYIEDTLVPDRARMNLEFEASGQTTLRNLNAYRMRVTCAHLGPPLEVLMINPHDEPGDEDGIWYCWDALLWADDETPVGDLMDDLYSDALRDELIEIAKNWTSRNG